MSTDASRQTALLLTDGCKNNWMVQMSPFNFLHIFLQDWSPVHDTTR